MAGEQSYEVDYIYETAAKLFPSYTYPMFIGSGSSDILTEKRVSCVVTTK